MSTSKNYSLLLYFILSVIVSWLSAGIVTNFSLPLSSQEVNTLGPLMYVAMLTGPFLASLFLITQCQGKRGLATLWARLVKWKVSSKWYVFAFALAPSIALFVLALLSLYSKSFIPSLLTTPDKLALILQGVFTGLFVGLFEEIGWTGFATPQLLKKQSVLKTGLIIGLVWGLWHFIPFWEGNTFSDPMGFLLLLVRLFTWLIPFRILLVWLYSHTNSLLLNILMHASAVFTTLALPSMELQGANLILWILSWTLALWIVTAVVLAQKK